MKPFTCKTWERYEYYSFWRPIRATGRNQLPPYYTTTLGRHTMSIMSDMLLLFLLCSAHTRHTAALHIAPYLAWDRQAPLKLPLPPCSTHQPSSATDCLTVISTSSANPLPLPAYDWKRRWEIVHIHAVYHSCYYCTWHYNAIFFY